MPGLRPEADAKFSEQQLSDGLSKSPTWCTGMKSRLPASQFRRLGICLASARFGGGRLGLNCNVAIPAEEVMKEIRAEEKEEKSATVMRGTQGSH